MSTPSVSPSPAVERSVRIAALSLGFDAAGIAPSEPVATAAAFRVWLVDCPPGLEYMARTENERTSLRGWIPWARSVIMVATRYRAGDASVPGNRARFAGYATGTDYHDWFRHRLVRLGRMLPLLLGRTVQWKPFCDTSPVLERYYAAAAGLGWIGYNALLIHPVFGSYVLLGGIATDAVLKPADLVTPACGTCRRCLAACPTGALPRPYYVDARRCLSYHTIESRDSIPASIADAMGNRVFGCDACQEECPMNRRDPNKGPGHRGCIEPSFRPHRGTSAATLTQLANMNAPTFRDLYRRTAAERAGHAGLVRNAQAALSAQRKRSQRHRGG